jgi:PleD family two-component response regulator
MALERHTPGVVLERTVAGGIARLKHERFHAIATDINLPDSSGLDVIAAARAALPACGIVAITGFVDVGVAVQAMQAGADDFLGKPFDIQVLWHMLNKAVDSRQRRLEAGEAENYRRLAYTDALTGCPNRRCLDEAIASAVELAERDGLPLTLGYIDIDNFKLLNDFVGHEEGDHVLQRVAEALAAHIKPPAQFARFGGDHGLAHPVNG